MAENSEKKLKKTSSFRYAVGMFGTSIPINMFKTFATAFYVDRLSFITFEQFAIITAVYTFLDAIDNPVYGFLSDRTRSRWGRRRPWLVIGAPLLVLAYIMFFNPPPFMQPGSAFAYVLIMYMLTGTLDSLINANYGALFPELFRTETERAKTNAIRQMFQLTAMVLSIALTPVITDEIGFSRTALVYGLLAIAVIWFMAFGSHEDLSLMEKPKPGLFSSIKAVITNPKFWKNSPLNPTALLDPDKDRDLKIYIACGLQDDIFLCSRLFQDRAEALGIRTECVFEDGTHNWDFWEKHIRLFIDFALK